MDSSEKAMEQPISMTLNGNRFLLKESTGQWMLESSDLDTATLEIEKLVDEKQTLVHSLSTAVAQIEELQKEVIEVNDMKSVILEMVCQLCFFLFLDLSFQQLMSERQKRIQVEEELEAYKEELKESFAVIVELRYLAFSTLKFHNPFSENYCRSDYINC